METVYKINVNGLTKAGTDPGVKENTSPYTIKIEKYYETYNITCYNEYNYYGSIVKRCKRLDTFSTFDDAKGDIVKWMKIVMYGKAFAKQCRECNRTVTKGNYCEDCIQDSLFFTNDAIF